jgi:cation:H+ antiporter
MIWIWFFVSAGVVLVAGTTLTRYADVLCERFGLGRFLIGILLLGVVTSLPELITSVVSVARFGAADLAAGNIFGSNNFNPLLLVAMDISYRQGSLTDRVIFSRSHAISAGGSILLTMIVLAEIVWGARPLAGALSWGGALVFALYAVAIRLLSRREDTVNLAVSAKGQRDIDLPSAQKMWLMLFLSIVLVVVGSVMLTESAETIAEITGWGRTLVGSLLLAIVTSLPEAVVTLSSLRMDSVGMAVGNIFGSSLFNIVILVICGFFYPLGMMLDVVSLDQIGIGLMSVVITGVATCGIFWKQKPVWAGLGIDSWVMLMIFLCGNYLIHWKS